MTISDSRQPPRIVVVEDEPLVRELAVAELEDGGFDVADFATADEALRHLTTHAGVTSLVFTDVQMPGTLSGLDLTAIIADAWPALPVLVTSGGCLVHPALLPACAHFVPKPWRAADILWQVRRLLPHPGHHVSM